MSILSSTQGQVYLLPLDEDIDIISANKLKELRPFIKNVQDLHIIDALLFYKVPHFFSVIKEEKKGTFAYITTFMGKEKAGTNIQFTSELLPFKQLFAGENQMPHLYSAIYQGVRDIETIAYEKLDEKELFSLAKKNKDLLVILGQPGTGKTQLMKDISKRFSKRLRFDPSFLDTSLLSVKDYLDKIDHPQKGGHPLYEDLSSRKHHFINFIYLYEDAIEEIKYLYRIASDHGDTLVITQVKNLWEKLVQHQISKEYNAAPLLKLFYGLPTNEYMMADNGWRFMKEILTKLNNHAFHQLLQDEIAQLEQFNSLNQSIDVAGYALLEQIKKTAIHKILTAKNEYLNKEEKKEISGLYDKIILSFKKNSHKENDQNQEILAELKKELADENQESMATYFADFSSDGTIFAEDTLLIDLDGCEINSVFYDKINKAQKLIVFGSYPEGLFELFLKAANNLQNKDGVKRVFYLPNIYRHNCALSRFISKNFYDHKNIPSALPTTLQKSGVYPFRYITGGQVLSHIRSHISDGQRIALMLHRYDESVDLGAKLNTAEDLSNLPVQIFIGTPKEAGNKTFDIVFLFDSEPFTSFQLMQAIARAENVVYMVGNPENIVKDSPIKDFYYICAGDNQNGKLY